MSTVGRRGRSTESLSRVARMEEGQSGGRDMGGQDRVTPKASKAARIPSARPGSFPNPWALRAVQLAIAKREPRLVTARWREHHDVGHHLLIRERLVADEPLGLARPEVRHGRVGDVLVVSLRHLKR